jgi:hypothetical protein
MKYLDLAIANEIIKTTNIKGKEYAEVNQRIKAFRMVYPQGTIVTDMLSNENGICIFKARVSDNEGHILGTGTAYEKEDSTFINKTSYIENCETSAVGRALGMAGFGIDVSVASAEEIANAIQNQTVTQAEADNYTLNFGKYKNQTLKEIYEQDKKYIEWLINNTQDERFLQLIQLATGIEIPTEEETQQRLELINNINHLVVDTETDYEDIYKHFEIKSINELTIAQLKECEQILNKKKESDK